MDPKYAMFIEIIGALGTLVVAATIVERGLAFIFEHEWFLCLFTKDIPDPADLTKTVRVSKIPGFKGLIALTASMSISFGYDFDILHILFATNSTEPLGKLSTGFVIAGGSAGAIAVFQSYLNINKDSRDAIIAAKKAEAESAKQIAEFAVKKAKADQEKAEIEKNEAALRRQIVQSEISE